MNKIALGDAIVWKLGYGVYHRVGVRSNALCDASMRLYPIRATPINKFCKKCKKITLKTLEENPTKDVVWSTSYQGIKLHMTDRNGVFMCDVRIRATNRYGMKSKAKGKCKKCLTILRTLEKDGPKWETILKRSDALKPRQSQDTLPL